MYGYILIICRVEKKCNTRKTVRKHIHINCYGLWTLSMLVCNIQVKVTGTEKKKKTKTQNVQTTPKYNSCWVYLRQYIILTQTSLNILVIAVNCASFIIFWFCFCSLLSPFHVPIFYHSFNVTVTLCTVDDGKDSVIRNTQHFYCRWC